MNKIKSFMLPLLLLFMVACSQDDNFSDGDGQNGTKLVPVTIMLPGSPSHTQTRSRVTELGSEQENKIDSLFLTLKFGTEVVEKTISGTDLSALSDQDTYGNPLIKVNFDVDFTIWNSASTIDATVFANYRTVPAAISRETDFWNGDVLKPLFMSGRTVAMPKEENGKVELVRQVAKLRTKISKTTDCIPANLQILYDEIKVQVLHVADHSAALNGDPVIGQIIPIDYDLRDARNIITSNDYQPNLTVDSCYIHENIYGGTDPDSITTLSIKIPTLDPLTNHKEILEKEFQIKGSTGFNIERNHIYTLDIKIRSQKEPLDIFLNVQPWRIQNIDDPNLEPVHSY